MPTEDIYQLAIWYLKEHQPENCDDFCPITRLESELNANPYDVSVLMDSPILNVTDIARGEMLGHLCEMLEPPGYLFTNEHEFIQIDNELMFSLGAGADLCKCPWVVDGNGKVRKAGVRMAVELCEQLLALPDVVFEEALLLPDSYHPTMEWDLREQLQMIRPRARDFLQWASKNIFTTRRNENYADNALNSCSTHNHLHAH